MVFRLLVQALIALMLAGCLEPVAMPNGQTVPVRITIVDSLSTPLSTLHLLPGEGTCVFANLSIEANPDDIHYFWAINGTVIATGGSLCIQATDVGLDTVSVFATDASKGQIRDTLHVTTNTPPKIYKDLDMYSPSSDTVISPASSRGIPFTWSVFDPDPDEELEYTLLLANHFNWIDTVYTKSDYGIWYNQDLLAGESYEWKLIVRDRLGAADTSDFYTFTTTDQP